MRSAALGALVIACATLMVTPATAGDGDARLLVQETLEALPTAPFEARAKLSGDYRGDREFALKHKVIDGARATYVEVVAPDFLVGMRFLFKERIGQAPQQHMRYVASRLPVLVARDTRSEPFLGSTFSLVDLVEPELDAFSYQLAGNDTVAGRACKLVQSTPKEPEQEVYGKIVMAIDPKDHLVLRRKVFDRQGRPLKEWTGAKVEKIDGHWTVLDQRMKDLPKDVESRIEITQIRYGVDIPDSVFTTDYLAR
jgi:hypothetical protein